MKVKFIPSEEFMRQFKRLAKKYPSLVSDYDTFKKAYDRYQSHVMYFKRV